MRNDCRKVVSLASESRKIRKPLMEKKRRARINDSLEILKQILLESKTTLKATSTSNRNGQRTTAKLEKADILEMTVRYLQHLRNRIDHHRDESSLSQMKEEEIQIRPADSSCDNKYDSCVALVPARLPNGTIAFVVPTSSMDGEKRTSANLQGEQCVWRPW